MLLRTICLSGLLLCAIPVAAETNKPATFTGDIRVFGSLLAMMHEDQTASQIALDALPQTPRLFGLGALEDLAGEVLILDGQTYLSYPKGDNDATTQPMGDPAAGAALLVTAEVEAWDGFVVDTDVAWEAFEETLAVWVERSGWDAQQRLPFQILGTFPDLQWHVVDGRRLQGGGDSHEEHLQAASRLQATAVQARIFGFYSPSDQGVFTHRNSISHLHSLTASQQMGHVDQLVVPAGARVLFPSRQEPEAVALVDAMLKSLGTAADRQAIASLTTEAACSGPGGEFTTTIRSMRPDRVYFEQVSSRGTSKVWSLPNDQWGMNEAGEVTDVPSRVRPFVRGHEFHLLFLEMRQRFSGFRILATEERDGEECRRIAMLDEFGNPATLLIRMEDQQALELVLHPPGSQGAVVVVPHVWKERDGVQYFRGFVLTEGADRVFRYRFTRIEPNTVEAAFFERPEASKQDKEAK